MVDDSKGTYGLGTPEGSICEGTADVGECLELECIACGIEKERGCRFAGVVVIDREGNMKRGQAH